MSTFDRTTAATINIELLQHPYFHRNGAFFCRLITHKLPTNILVKTENRNPNMVSFISVFVIRVVKCKHKCACLER